MIKLKELFDTTQNLKWTETWEGYTTTFTGPNNRKYRININSLSEYDTIPKEAVKLSKKIMGTYQQGEFEMEGYNLDFEDTGLGNDDPFKITGMGGTDTAKIFGIIVNATIKKLKTIKAKYVYFSAKEPSRIALYSKMAPLMARQMGFQVYHEGSTFIMSKEPFEKLKKK